MSPSTRSQAFAGVRAEGKGESSTTLCPRASSLFTKRLVMRSFVALIEVVWTEVLANGSTLQEVIASGDNGVRHGNHGSLHSACRGQTTELRGKVSTLRFRRRPSSFAQRMTSPRGSPYGSFHSGVSRRSRDLSVNLVTPFRPTLISLSSNNSW